MAVMTTAPEELERMRIRREQDEASALSYAEERGIKKVAKKMKAEDFDVDIIVRITGLTVDDILRL